MIRRDLIAAILLTFMVTVLFFGIQLTRSAAPYDAWLDTNDDGTINMRDIGATVQAFGTSGDPTKNVNVTNWPSCRVTLHSINCTWTDGYGAYSLPNLGSTAGYSRMGIMIVARDWKQTVNIEDYANFTINSISWFAIDQESLGSFSSNPLPFPSGKNTYAYVALALPPTTRVVGTTGVVETCGQYFTLTLGLRSNVLSGWAILDVYAYCRNE